MWPYSSQKEINQPVIRMKTEGEEEQQNEEGEGGEEI